MMLPLSTLSQTKTAGKLATPKPRRAPLRLDRALVESLIAVVLGLVLGIYVLGASLMGGKLTLLMVVVMALPFLLMIIGDIRRPLLAVIVLDTVFQLDTNFAFNQQIADHGSISGYNFSVTTMALIVLYGLWLSELLTRRIEPNKDLGRMCLPLAIYVGFVSLSLLAATDVLLSSFELVLLLQMFLLYVYIVGTVRTHQDVIVLVSAFMVGVIGLGIFLMAEYRVGHNFNIPGLSTVGDRAYNSDGYFRPGGPIGSPIDAASFFGLVLVPSLSIFLTRLKGWPRWLAMMCLGCGTIGLVLTLSRGGWIAFFVASSILCFFAWRRGWLSISVPLVMLAVLVGLGLVFQDAIFTRLTADDNGSAHARVTLTKLAFDMIRDYPLLGIGTNNFAAVFKQYLTPDFNGEWIYSIHDKYLMVWVETGIGGLIAYLVFFLTTIRRGWLVWRRGDRLLSPLALGFIAAIIGQMIHMAVDVFHSRPQVQGMWLVAGLVTAMYHNFREDSHAVE